ncbi:hypothetical protein [Candidatus Korarchaeum cryptofilum]|uniref:Uncharacterized protein n=1 Tax=Korarchaeum cryptofilum (strain OPF8) TaxID=374847 RepID=B1L3E2_KORCO|nr:hypothetical protein [Candidatus Korarchaeum cryptofilum]ACB06971.1 hypothetical protein Kcr_0211 [Candidatus Korarchaeum cryptofilum OPF8]
MVPTNIAVIKSRDPRVREAIRYTLNSLGLFWEEVHEPDPIKHMVSIFPEESEFVPVVTPSIFIGSTALAYFGGDKVEGKRSPPMPSGFLELNKEKSPFFGSKYSFDCERLSRTNPIFRKDGSILVGYDLFKTVAYFLMGAELSLGMKQVKTPDNRINLAAISEIRGVEARVPAADLHARLLLSLILMLHKSEGLPLVLKRASPPGRRGALAISVPVQRIGRSRSLIGKLKNLLRKREIWIEKISKIQESITFFAGRGEDYSPSGIGESLLALEENGHEVGLLASPKASVSHEAILDEYRELAEILKRGDLGIRFRSIESTINEAFESAMFVKAKYTIVGEIYQGFGYPLGVSRPLKVGSIWSIPTLGRVRRERAADVMEEIAKRGSFVSLDAMTELSVLTAINEALKREIWITTPSKMIERLEGVYNVRGTFRYDRRYLEGKITSQTPLDVQILVIPPDGKETVLELNLEENKPHQINLRI